MLLPRQECLTRSDPSATRPSRGARSFGSGRLLMFLLTKARADLQISASHAQSSGSLLLILHRAEDVQAVAVGSHV